MPKFDVIVTVDTTESAVIRVEADSMKDANYKALDEARLNGPKYDWQPDDNVSWQPYLGDEDGATLVEDDAPPLPRPPVPHATVVQIADAHRELTLLHMKQATTMATMIRACLSRIQAESRGHWDIDAHRKAKRERAEALKGLADLATMLEAKGTPAVDVSGERAK